jgi:hypothetical protein
LAIMGNVSNPVIVAEMREFQKAANTLGLGSGIFEIRRMEDIACVDASSIGKREQVLTDIKCFSAALD